jgi:hypothetical protein
MDLLVLLLLLVAVVCFALAMFNVPTRWNMVGAGLLAWVLSVFIPALAGHF